MSVKMPVLGQPSRRRSGGLGWVLFLAVAVAAAGVPLAPPAAPCPAGGPGSGGRAGAGGDQRAGIDGGARARPSPRSRRRRCRPVLGSSRCASTARSRPRWSPGPAPTPDRRSPRW